MTGRTLGGARGAAPVNRYPVEDGGPARIETFARRFPSRRSIDAAATLPASERR